MRLCDALREKELDLRLRDRHVAEGRLRSEDVEKYLKSLDDDSERYVEATAYIGHKQDSG